MSFAFFKKALGFKKNVEEQQFEEFMKCFHTESSFSNGQLSKFFLKNALRLIVVRKSTESVLYDSMDELQTPFLESPSGKVDLLELAFGLCPLAYQRDLKSMFKVHDFGYQVLLTCVFCQSEKVLRSNRSTPFGLNLSGDRPTYPTWIDQPPNPSASDLRVAACVIVNIDWPLQMVKSLSSGFTRTSSQTAPETFAKSFYALLFDHFLQISVALEILVRNIGLSLSSTVNKNWLKDVSSHDSKYYNSVQHEKINIAFNDFRQSLCDLCLPRLCRPVWSSLSLAFASRQEALNLSRRFNCRSPVLYQGFLLGRNPSPVPFELMADSFVRGCLWSLITSYASKDRCYFLAQLVTGLLMYHRGWVPTVFSDQDLMADSDGTLCKALSTGFTPISSNEENNANSLLKQFLVHAGNGMNRHSCADAKVLNNSGTVMAKTVILGNIHGSGLQQHQQRERLLCLIYFSSYFLRPPHLLLQTYEQLPDLGLAELYDLGQHKRRRNRAISTTRRHPTGQINAPSIVGQRRGAFEVRDSGVASQEDLNSSAVQATRRYSASAGSIPSVPPPVGTAAAVCLPGRLTDEQCRFAEAAAYLLVTSELAKKNPNLVQPQSTAITKSDARRTPSSTHRQHTWTGGMSGRNRQALLRAAAEGTGAGGRGEPVGSVHFYTPISPNASSFVHIPPASTSSGLPSTSSSSSNINASNSELTEIPLLIEKSYDNWDRCWCLGEGIVPSVLGKSSLICGSASSGGCVAVNRGYADGKYSTSTIDDSVEVGTVCDTDTEVSDDGTQSCRSTDEGPELTLHNPIGASILEHFSNGLVLQATTEPVTAFQPRLTAELTSWLQFAPALLQRGVAPSLNLRTGSHIFAPVAPKRDTFRSSALLVDVDASTVEVLTVRNSAPPVVASTTTGARPNSMGQHGLLHSTTPPSRLSPFGKYQLAECGPYRRTPMTPSTQPSTKDEVRTAVISQKQSLVPAPLIIRLLESVKLVYDTSGGCSSITLQHLEAQLQNICLLGRVLADLMVPSITSPEGENNVPLLLKEHPDTVALLLGCHRNDLPLLLAIANSISCKAAAAVETFDLGNFF